jgi:hypothetical protein
MTLKQGQVGCITRPLLPTSWPWLLTAPQSCCWQRHMRPCCYSLYSKIMRQRRRQQHAARVRSRCCRGLCCWAAAS